MPEQVIRFLQIFSIPPFQLYGYPLGRTAYDESTGGHISDIHKDLHPIHHHVLPYQRLP